MTVRSSLFAVALACAASCTTAADAQLGKPTTSQPATASDLVGKKICWIDGGIPISGLVVDSRIMRVSTVYGW